jgi:DUF3096 family protein
MLLNFLAESSSPVIENEAGKGGAVLCLILGIVILVWPRSLSFIVGIFMILAAIGYFLAYH